MVWPLLGMVPLEALDAPLALNSTDLPTLTTEMSSSRASVAPQTGPLVSISIVPSQSRSRNTPPPSM